MATQTPSSKGTATQAGAPPRGAPTGARIDPQPNATQIKPGATDRGAHHLHAGAQHKPSHAQVERRAYEIWLRRGGGDGNAAVDWLQAERELMTEINGRNAD
jgi:hypothetical protein